MKKTIASLFFILMLSSVFFGCQKSDIKSGTATENPQTNPNYSYSVLDGKTAVFLGDSICAGKTVAEDSPEYGYGWAGIIGSNKNMNWVNLGRNGAVITPIEGNDRIIPDQLDYAIKNYPQADYIIFEGGVNDADSIGNDEMKLGKISADFENFDTDTFSGAFESFVLQIKKAYPEAKIGYIIPPKMGDAPYDSENNVRRKYFERAIEICEKWEIPYLDLWNESSLDPSLQFYYDSELTDEKAKSNKYYTDGLHLTLKGYYEIIPQIESFMMGL